MKIQELLRYIFFMCLGATLVIALLNIQHQQHATATTWFYTTFENNPAFDMPTTTATITATSSLLRNKNHQVDGVQQSLSHRSLATRTGTQATTSSRHQSSSFDILQSIDICPTKSQSSQRALAKEIADYEKSQRFQDKIKEVKGLAPVGAHHVSIDKYLREKVLQPKEHWSVLELGCAAGKMLSMVEEWYYESTKINTKVKGNSSSRSSNNNNKAVFVGVELVPGWVDFAQSYFSSKDDVVAQSRVEQEEGDQSYQNRNIHIYQGDVTAFTPLPPLPPLPPMTSKNDQEIEGKQLTSTTTFDLVMLNDVAEHIQKDRYPCLFQELQKVTHESSLVYFHTPNPQTQMKQRANQNSVKQAYENVLPHHQLIAGMAKYGFELVTLEQDVDTDCSSNRGALSMKVDPQTMLHLRKHVSCAYDWYPKYYHAVFRRVPKDKLGVFDLQ